MNCSYVTAVAYGVHFGTAILALVVAVLLFRIFPKTHAEVEGPIASAFGELRFKAGGALGGFLVVFCVLVLLTPNINRSLAENFCGPQLEKWSFSIPIYIVGPDGSLETDISRLKDEIKVELEESVWSIPGQNSLEFYYPIDPTNITDRLKRVSIEIPESVSADGNRRIVHEVGYKDLASAQDVFSVDYDKKRIVIGSPIVIRRTEFDTRRQYDSDHAPAVDTSSFDAVPAPPVLPAGGQ